MRLAACTNTIDPTDGLAGCILCPQDLYQHSAWMVRVKGLEAQVDSKKAMDFSDFYKKFGLQQGDDEEEDEGGAAGSSTR